MIPYVLELPNPPSVLEALAAVAQAPGCLLLESARHDARLGRYSFLAVDPFAWIEFPPGEPDPFGKIASQILPYREELFPILPPFQGGLAGIFGYDLSRSLERIPPPRFDEFQFPAAALGIYDVVLAWDHRTDSAWILSQGFPETDRYARTKRAVYRGNQLRQAIRHGWNVARGGGAASAPSAAPTPPLALESLAPSFPVGPGKVMSNFSAPAYRAAVQKGVEYVHAGDIFQVNLSQRLLHPAEGDSLSLYRRLRERNPATFGGYFDLGAFQVASASPERFLQVRSRKVETRPIKGTRRRSSSAEADLFLGDDLRESEKDRAENVMIVDLLRNDLSKVCDPESVRVTQLCGLETYQFVQHLVSVVVGELASNRTPIDLAAAAFPGGSITGAPKVRAMEIISELEPTARGAYCGSLGYLSFSGELDLNILIRTIIAGRGWWQMPVGGGIVAQSDPQQEYEETWHKAKGLLESLLP